ncbi:MULTISPECIES: TetR/AcrR family transcriptional regulator [Enterobacteriaceae]|uniref:TetR/AcrR family transcriptional regulator n=1 Tax=Enterobacteriaceae TaxID=543 RepID=UPI000AF697A3|nr:MULTISPECIES: TetR/AcrR family transcriptional regulator [Enterobacteriaceae]MEC3929202.1 TetR/AcrR family transcriptional regulator [Citrobacter braakii]
MMIGLTRERLLNEAGILMRSHGYSAFSYADLSRSIGITKASIHHHFPTKDILGEQVVLEAINNTTMLFDEIETQHQHIFDRLAAYMKIFSDGYRASSLPLCCALSADMANLPENVRLQATKYFELQINWLTTILSRGIEAGEIRPGISAKKTALLIMNICEGASVVARAINDPDIFDNSIEQIITILS